MSDASARRSAALAEAKAIVQSGSRLHMKAREKIYPKGPERFKVEDKYVPWAEKYPNYAPVSYTAPIVASNPPWADKDEEIREYKWNNLDPAHKVDRTSAEGIYKFDPETRLPLNPKGRTGIKGRGLLGRYGPNHAADPIVTQWKRDEKGHVVKDSHGNPILQFVTIKRNDNGQWAIPGGMVDPGEAVSVTVKREFGEEALNSIELSAEEKAHVEKMLHDLFDPSKCTEIYKGYVDDPRNTDNAWMETTALNIHDETGEAFKHFKLKGGDDAAQAVWKDYEPGMDLYASHVQFLAITYEFRKRFHRV